MTVYTYSGPAPTSQTTRFVANGGFSRSVLSGAIQTVSRPGSRWEMELLWQELTHDKTSQVMGFFSRLNGTEHRARIPIYGHTQQGNAAGTPLVNGASQTGNDLDFDGVAAITDFFKAGDIFTFNPTGFNVLELKMVTEDLTTTTGVNNVKFVPEIRNSPANNDSIFHTSLTADWILTSPVQMVASARRRDVAGDALSDIRLTFVDDIAA